MNGSIIEFGAKVCDQLQTDKIQAAIDAVFLAGGGRVTVPMGTWRCGGIRLRSNVTLYLETGAIIEGSRNPEDYTENLFDLSFDGNHRWCCNRSLTSITFENCNLKGAIYPIHIHGDENEPLSITLKDCTIEVDEECKGIAFATVKNCEKFHMENVKVVGYDKPRIVKYNDFEFITENSTALEITEE